MGYLNKVLLIGRLGQDPEKRITPAGHSVVNISLATTEYFKDKSGNKQEKTEWSRVVFWNKQAELVEQYCKKGSQLYVEGSLQTREWQDKDGNKRYSTDIVARSMQFLDSKQQQNTGYQQSYQDQQAPNGPQGGYNPNHDGPTGAGQDDYLEQDVPF
jgi:single-strand DNA-binding protein